MIQQIDPRAFFQFELPVHYVPRLPRAGEEPHWRECHRVPELCAVSGAHAFAKVRWGWNEDAFVVDFDVQSGHRPQCDPVQWWKQDGIRLCIDTRDARDVKRATRFCHLFYFLPRSGGTRGSAPLAGTHRMSKSKEPPPAVDCSLIQVHSSVGQEGYRLWAVIPAACLQGWDPAEHPRIGLFYKVKDRHAGDQHLSVNDELGWNTDPSTWAVGVLLREEA